LHYLLTGETGFIGSALKKELDKIMTEGDHPDYFFHFGSPPSQRLFDEDYHCIRETIEGFIEACEYCKRHRCKLIFPSSSTVYDNNDSYSRTKSALEDIAEAYGIDYLALRIFAGYGPGEGHKRSYASPIYLFAKDIVRRRSPVVYGDGTQERDFVYIDDIVRTIIENLETSGIIDIGTGISYSFNSIIEMINRIYHTNIKPTYVGKPAKYVQSTKCARPLHTHTPIFEGIRRVCVSLQS
jgi:UDP-glucose 4-epimerase